ncbi:MAG: alkaline phosphatase family protein [Chitinophagaceae bacterium]|nr:alkaline phosphatase family protein [Chitinophagaceae bacterium]
MKSIIFVSSLLFVFLISFGQASSNESNNKNLPRPKLVVGLMVDQMRWDFLYRYYDRFGQGGFKRMLGEGFTCENAMIPYAQTVTAAGHASVYTGSVPAINGIMGNEWFDREKGDYVYCVEDNTVKTIGADSTAEPMSPRNLFTSTISDELRLATNFRSKVVGVAIKDRGSILPAGHSGEAYWYDSKTGNFVTSTYYHQTLPGWVSNFNARKIPDSLYALEWNTLYPIETYVQSDKDNNAYEGRFVHEQAPVFPHKLSGLIGTNYGTISSTPHGNTMTLEFGKAALRAQQLGKDEITDMLAISLSSPDYAGHQFGPNSIEIEDIYLRLDKELELFFNFLDAEVGKGEWLFFLTADHGVAHVPGFMQKNKVAGGSSSSLFENLNKLIEAKYKISNAILATANYHLYFNKPAIENARKSLDEVIEYTISEIEKDKSVLMAFDARKMREVNMPAEMLNRYINGYNKKLAGDVIIVNKAGYLGSRIGTTHGAWYPYDAHIPMVFMGWGVKHGRTNRPTYMTDISATIAALLRIQAPNGCIGTPVTEITN